MPPVSGIDAESSANASAPHSTISPPSTQTPIINTGSGTRVAMPAGVRKMPPPMVMPITRPIELKRPSLRTSVAIERGYYPDNPSRCLPLGVTRISFDELSLSVDDRVALHTITHGAARHTTVCAASCLPRHKQVALQSALQVLNSGAALDRPDTPDEVVTAVRRLPAVEAAYAPFPAGIDPRLRAAFESRGVTAALHAPGRGVRPRREWTAGRRHHADGVGQDALLQPAGPRSHSEEPVGARAVSVSDQGARAGSDGGAARADHRNKRSAARSAAKRSAYTPTTATRRRTRAAPFARARTSCSSNPDMVHSGILPHHPRWAKLFENLDFIVIDELHAYRGVFGSHLTNVLRRLQRICRHYGSNPQFICSSATIANPAELAERLAEKPFALVEKSGAPTRREVLRLRQSAGRQSRARHPALVHRGVAPRRR